MSAAYEFLRKDEWTMGNGQCPDCFGKAPGKWYRAPGGFRPAHPLAPTPGHEGHAPGCPRAAAIVELGGDVVYRTADE